MHTSTLVTENLKAEIVNVYEQFIADFNCGDAAAVASHYTEDAVLLPSDSLMVNGRASIQAFWHSELEILKDASLTITVQKVEKLNEDLIFETGNYTIVVQPFGSEARTNKGEYAVVWKRQNGQWKQHIDFQR